MPDPVRLIRTLHQAIRACRETPGRRGHVIVLDEVTDVLVAGDLHGNVENFRRIFHRADLAHNPRRHLVLQELIHGPFRYSGGGDKSHQVLDLFASLKCQYPAHVHGLLGNHELAQWTGQWIAKGDADLNESFRAGINEAYCEHADAIYAAYEGLFAAMPLAVRTPNRIFLSHSMPNAAKQETWDAARLLQDGAERSDLEPGGFVHSLVWGRDTREETATAFLAKVDADLLITGHIPAEQGFAAPNSRQLILDALASPAGCCLFPTDRPLTHAELMANVLLL